MLPVLNVRATVMFTTASHSPIAFLPLIAHLAIMSTLSIFRKKILLVIDKRHWERWNGGASVKLTSVLTQKLFYFKQTYFFNRQYYSYLRHLLMYFWLVVLISYLAILKTVYQLSWLNFDLLLGFSSKLSLTGSLFESSFSLSMFINPTSIKVGTR